MGVIWVCFFAATFAVACSAPTPEDEEQQAPYSNIDSSVMESYLRGKRLNNVYPMTPCAAAAAAASAANIPVVRSPGAVYPTFVPPEARYYVPTAYDYANSRYAANMYRYEDPYSDSREFLRYSDSNFMDQDPAARFAYRTAASAYLPLNSVGSQFNVQNGASSSAYGVFPSSVGNCNVPLLFSCSPSVVAGHLLAKPETQVYGSPPAFSSGATSHADSFGGAAHYQRIHTNPEQAAYENAAPVNKATSPHSNEKSP